uniref:BED-type domain-containing protein n=1 Tax=Mola mola TaxID=94237 RepID=A0A3Q3WIE1_MOLML
MLNIDLIGQDDQHLSCSLQYIQYIHVNMCTFTFTFVGQNVLTFSHFTSSVRGDGSRKWRKYDHDYLKFAFSWTGPDDAPLPQCVICKEVLANDTMRPFKLQRHIETKQPSLVTEPRDFSDRKLKELRSQKKENETFCKHQRDRSIISCGATHSMCSLNMIPVHGSDSPFFSFQLDESTDVANSAQLMVCVCASFCFDFMEESRTDWDRCCGTCTDGARSGETGAVWQFCIIHHRSLVTNVMSKELHAALEEAVEIVNLIKSRGVNARLFSILCSEMGAHCQHLLLHTEVWGLSRGKVLTRLSSFHEEVLIFLMEISSPLVKHMEDMSWVPVSASLSDIFEQIITLNTSLQGKQCHVFVAHRQVSAFRKQLDLLCSPVERGSVETFPTLEDVVGRAGLNLDSVQELVKTLERSKLREYPELATLALKTHLPFQSTHMCEAGVSALTLTKIRLRSRLDVRNMLCLSLMHITPRCDHLVSGKQTQGSR